MMTKRKKTDEAGPLASEGTNGSASAALPGWYLRWLETA